MAYTSIITYKDFEDTKDKRFSSLFNIDQIQSAKDYILSSKDMEEITTAADYIFRKCAMAYKFPLDELDGVREKLKTAYKSIREYRYAFMKFHYYYDPVTLQLAYHYFNNKSFPEFTSIVLLSQFIISHGSDQEIEEMCNRILAMSKDKKYSTVERANLIDILLRSFSKPMREEATTLLNALREEEKSDSKGGLYGDSQNVHNDEVSVSINKVLKTLNSLITGNDRLAIEGFNIEDTYKEFLALLSTYVVNAKRDIKDANSDANSSSEILKFFTRENLFDAFERIKSDYAKFVDDITLYVVFRNIYLLIDGRIAVCGNIYKNGTNEYKSEMKIRLLEELCTGVQFCSRGYLTRLISSIQGFDNFLKVEPDKNFEGFDPKSLQILISDSTRLEAIVANILKGCIESSPDSEQIIMDMIDDPQKYYEFLIDSINANATKLKEYKDEDSSVEEFCKKYIIPGMHKFVGTTQPIFDFIDRQIVLI